MTKRVSSSRLRNCTRSVYFDCIVTTLEWFLFVNLCTQKVKNHEEFHFQFYFFAFELNMSLSPFMNPLLLWLLFVVRSSVGVSSDGKSIFGATYSFALTSQPVHAVRVTLTVVDTATDLPSNQTRLSDRYFSFGAKDWSVQRSVTVTATSADSLKVLKIKEPPHLHTSL